jgi:hypothetical protein
LTNGFSPLLSTKTKKHIVARNIKNREDNTITMTATSAAAAASNTQRQTLPPLG